MGATLHPSRQVVLRPRSRAMLRRAYRSAVSWLPPSSVERCVGQGLHPAPPFGSSFGRDQRSAAYLHDGRAVAPLEQIVEGPSRDPVLSAEPVDVIGYS